MSVINIEKNEASIMKKMKIEVPFHMWCLGITVMGGGGFIVIFLISLWGSLIS